jgi:uncharacterized protein (DUF4213/DUF364 family)
MTKKQFIKYMQLIQNFLSEQETLSALIYKISDGFSIVTIGNNLMDGLIDIIEESFDYLDIISWWLFEDVEKIIYINNVSISVKTLDELYDFLEKEKNKK